MPTDRSSPVVVTDGEQRAALAIVRSLGRAGHAVHVTSAQPLPLAGASRYCVSEQRTPDPLTHPREFAEQIERLVETTGAIALIPVADPALLALLPRRGSIRACMPFPDVETVRGISNKALLLGRAQKLGIAVPQQTLVADRSAEAALKPEDLQFPLVVKPSRSIGEGAGGRVKLGVRHAAGWTELKEHLDSMPDSAFPLLLQRRILGPGVGVFLLRWDGKLLAACAHRRIREKPPSGGVSVYRESVALDPALRDASLALLESFDWQGVAMVEYKVDNATGVPYLMEVNGRFWGSLQLAIDAGVDFPALLLDAALGRSPAPVTEYRTGLRSRWWWGEVDHLLARLGRSREDLALPPDAPTRLRAIGDFLHTGWPQDRNEVLRWDDLRPAFRETIDWFRWR